MTTATDVPAASPTPTPTASATADLSAQLTTIDDWRRLVRQALAPPQAEDLWAWCRRHLRMPSGARFDPVRARPWRKWMRVVQSRITRRELPGDPWAHRCEQLYLAAATQIAKSSTLFQIAAWCLANRPAPMAYYHARGKDLANARKNRLQRMAEQTPCLERLLPRGEEARERALGADVWTVGASLMHWLCANVAADLRDKALEFIFGDEIDIWAADVEEQGDPVQLAIDRQRTFSRTRLFVSGSSPGLPTGHAWSRICTGSHERMLVLCPDCGAADWLNPRQIVLAGDRSLTQVSLSEITDQGLARWGCRHCGSLHDASAVRRMAVEAMEAERWCPGIWAQDADHPDGHWTAQASFDAMGRLTGPIPPPQTVVRSAQVSALYAVTDVTLDGFAATWAAALQGNAARRKAAINSDWAEPSIEVITTTSTEDILASAQPDQPYTIGDAPFPIRAVICCFDQQGNTRDLYWWPWVVRGVAMGGESWLIASGEARSEAERDEVERRVWRVNGQPRRVDISAMDCANGNALFDVYSWASLRPQHRLVVRGDARLPDGVPWKEAVDSPGARRRILKPSGVREYRIAAHYWRTQIWDRRRRIIKPGWWLPSNAEHYYLQSLTSEEQVVERRRITGKGWEDVVVWRPRLLPGESGGERRDNHWWDCEADLAAIASILRLDQVPSAPTQPRPAHAQHAQPSLLDRRRSSLLRRR